MSFTRRRTLNFAKKSAKAVHYDKSRLSFYLVLVFFVIFGVIVLTDLFLEEDGSHSEPVSLVGGGQSEDYGATWETPVPLPQLSRNIKMEKSMVDGTKFRKKIISKQVEMQQLIRDISASMSRHPMIQRIRASREQFKYNHQQTVKVDPSLTEHSGWDAVWQPVNGTIHKFYVYSAYYDNRDKPTVRVIAATQTKKSNKVWCKLYYPDRQPILVEATISAIRENWNLKYSAAFVSCSLYNRSSHTFLDSPQSISVVAKLNIPASNQLAVHYANTGIVEPETSQLGVCVKPVHFYYNKTYQLIQFIELNKLLGVSRFTLYNDTMSDEVSCILSHYIREGTVQLLPWQLNMESQKEIRTEGLFAALNDCLYRSMNTFKYLMLIDFDEFIIPHEDSNLVSLVTGLSKRAVLQSGKSASPSQVSSFSFQNAFFYLGWPDDESLPANPELTAILKTRRKLKFHPPKQRSKE